MRGLYDVIGTGIITVSIIPKAQKIIIMPKVTVNVN